MTNEEFRLWLGGFFELADEDVPMIKRQLFIIGNHLNLAEAVEGKLDSFNEEFRRAIRAELDILPEPESTASPELVAELQAKLAARISPNGSF